LVESIFLEPFTTEITLGMENIPLTEDSAAQHNNHKQSLNVSGHVLGDGSLNTQICYSSAKAELSNSQQFFLE
jgi:hypothetical protein